MILSFLMLIVPLAATEIRVATFNTSLAMESRGRLAALLRGSTFSQAKRVAEVIQTIDPDIILLNEFDYDANGTALGRFNTNYLNVGQGGKAGVDYPYRYVAESNTGIHSGLDLDNVNGIDATPGDEGYGGDAWGFGEFEGKYAMAVLSKYPIDEEAVRTFQLLKWSAMPGALIPEPFYSPEEKAVLRLSSKSHWDVPIVVEGQRVHFLVSHPTPPVFDGAEDRNGKRNHDEIRLWADYLTEGADGYLVDDLGKEGGLGAGERFVIAGDQNADPTRGDSVAAAINQLLLHPRVDNSVTPERTGTASGIARTNTSTFNLRVDYVLPSKEGFTNLGGAVYWPDGTDNTLFGGLDHRPVYMDLRIEPTVEEAIGDLTIGVEAETVTLSWKGVESLEYGILASSDLDVWVPLDAVISFEGGVATATFSGAGDRRFLRVVVE